MNFPSMPRLGTLSQYDQKQHPRKAIFQVEVQAETEFIGNSSDYLGI